MQAFQNTDLILIIAGLAGLVLLGLLYSLRQYQNANRELKSRLETTQKSEYSLRESLNAAEKNSLAKQLELEKERELGAQKIEQFEENRRQLKIEFENLANRILEEKSRVFDKNNRSSLEALLKPFREQVEGFQKRINQVHDESLRGNTMLEGEIKKVLEIGLKIGSDAQNLTDALKGDSQRRGSWGETQLEKTLQMSGLIEHDHYEKQSSMRDAEGNRKQTDFLIKLPDDKHIIIDSKVSLAAYDRVVAAETDEQLERALAEHVKAVKGHINDLSGKDYTSISGIRSPSFVLMFMPIEPAYIEALKYEKDLFAYGFERDIVMVSHTTLIPILTTVANLWAMDRSTREARELGDKAGEIYNQVSKVAERLQKLGNSLQAVNNHYNDTARSLTGRQGLRGKVERFGEMSSKVTRTIPEIEPLHSDLETEGLQLLVEPLAGEDEKIEAVEDEAVEDGEVEVEGEARAT